MGICLLLAIAFAAGIVIALLIVAAWLLDGI